MAAEQPSSASSTAASFFSAATRTLSTMAKLDSRLSVLAGCSVVSLLSQLMGDGGASGNRSPSASSSSSAAAAASSAELVDRAQQPRTSTKAPPGSASPSRGFS
eukprot:CAMPEP_0198471776 /NCGR_PEP_ID=MMETSP1456-20131121/26129_1 /TAXON_ID=1461544 ORGANISM="Unidentified sp., Strain RCC1871" /NCGR_SAMPLE_ID=MMETSP1456 /ASSEMBLY_ACC=CAM_ASM_001119 /LENGTH=103 /DNA_ID=CAMNT_0044198365 /DNA_START=249 /DNA_END=561 /DNA_ORIENTATION=+